MSLLSLIIIREVKSDDIPDEVISDNQKICDYSQNG